MTRQNKEIKTFYYRNEIGLTLSVEMIHRYVSFGGFFFRFSIKGSLSWNVVPLTDKHRQANFLVLVFLYVS